MAYCTQEDILEQLPLADLLGLTDDTGIGVVDASVVARAIADADATIDAHCQGRYTVPLSPVPAMLRRLSVDLALYNLYSRRAEFELPEVRRDRNQAAIRFLERVAAGQILLGVSTPAPTTSGNAVEVTANNRLFTRASLEGF